MPSSPDGRPARRFVPILRSPAAPVPIPDPSPRGLLLVLVSGLLATSASAQFGSYIGTPAQAAAGASLDAGRDLDGDGVPDLVIGSPHASLAFSQQGFVRAYSGASTTTPLWHLQGSAGQEQLGLNVRFVDDLDGDGVADVITSTPGASTPGQTPLTYSGLLRALSGKTGATIWEKRGSQAFQYFGWSAEAVGDLNGDGRPEIACGSPGFDFPFPLTSDAGFVGLYDGATGAVISLIYGSGASAFFGVAVAGVGDVSGDGVPDFAVGTPDDDGAGPDAGRVDVYSGASKLKLLTLSGSPGARTGAAICAVGDVDGDGFDDFVVGSPSSGAGSGTVRLHRGPSGATAWTSVGSPGALFGTSLRGVGDMNKDGTPDVVVGAPHPSAAGTVSVFSGTNGKLLWTPITASGPGTQFGAAVAGAGDINGDGWIDLAVGEPGYDSGLPDVGRVLLMSNLLFALNVSNGGPGDAHLELYGGGLLAGEQMDLRVTKLTPNAPIWLIASPFWSLAAFKGGFIGPSVDYGLVFALSASPTGELFIPGIPGGFYDGSLYLQAVGKDVNLLKGFELSNAVFTPVSTM